MTAKVNASRSSASRSFGYRLCRTSARRTSVQQIGAKSALLRASQCGKFVRYPLFRDAFLPRRPEFASEGRAIAYALDPSTNSSCPALCRATTSPFPREKVVVGRDKPGHDDGDMRLLDPGEQVRPAQCGSQAIDMSNGGATFAGSGLT